MSEGLFSDDIDAETKDAMEWEKVNQRERMFADILESPTRTFCGPNETPWGNGGAVCVPVVHLLTRKKVYR